MSFRRQRLGFSSSEVKIFPEFAWNSSEKAVGSPLAAFYKRFMQVGNASISWKNIQSVKIWATKKTFEDQRLKA
jgi:hypothetical protein